VEQEKAKILEKQSLAKFIVGPEAVDASKQKQTFACKPIRVRVAQVPIS